MDVPEWCLGVERHGGMLVDERPWPDGWEGSGIWFDCEHDQNGHRWEVLYLTSSTPGRTEYVVRCVECHVPRCGDSNDRDPCMLRRHHPLREHLAFSFNVPDLNDRRAVEQWLR